MCSSKRENGIDRIMIKIICLGKIKENYLISLIEDYKKRIAKYHKIEIVELKDENNLASERINIEKHIEGNDYVIALAIEGTPYTSVQLAKKIEETFIHHSIITFIIGSSEGLHEEIKKKANLCLSFSSFTFPHGLFRGILLEQIYRSFKIINKETYHK